jgi:hypothetical protein
MKNDNPFAPWNSGQYDDDPTKPWNSEAYSADPFAPWNQPLSHKNDLDRYEREHRISPYHSDYKDF